jgi:hypothetical protein
VVGHGSILEFEIKNLFGLQVLEGDARPGDARPVPWGTQREVMVMFKGRKDRNKYRTANRAKVR